MHAMMTSEHISWFLFMLCIVRRDPQISQNHAEKSPQKVSH